MANQAPEVGRLRRLLRALRTLVVWLLALAAVGLVTYELTEPTPSVRPARDDGWRVTGALEIVGEVRGLTLQYSEGERLWATRYNEVWVSDRDGSIWQLAGRLGPAEAGWKAWLRHHVGASRTVRTLRHAPGVESLLVLRSGTVLAVRSPWIHRSTNGGRTWESVQRVGEAAASGPPRRRWGEDRRDRLWFGEPGGGLASASGRVWVATEDATKWEVAWSPSSGARVHALQIDPVHGRPWVVTEEPDGDHHLGWIEEEGDFRVVETGANVSASSLMFTGGSVLWASDPPEEPGGIWRWSRATDRVKQVLPIGGPVVSSTVLADGTLLLATATEGLGHLDAQLWVSRDGQRWRQLAQIPPFERPARRSWGTATFAPGEPMSTPLFNIDRLGRIERSVLVVSFR